MNDINFHEEEVRQVVINVIKAMPYLGKDNWCRLNTFFVLRKGSQWNEPALGMKPEQEAAFELWCRNGGNKTESGYVGWESKEVFINDCLDNRRRHVYLTVCYDLACEACKASKEVLTEQRLQAKAVEILIALLKEVLRYKRYILDDGTVIWGVKEQVEACYPDGNYQLSCGEMKDILKLPNVMDNEIYDSAKGNKNGAAVTIRFDLYNCDPVGPEFELNYNCKECKKTKGLVICPC